MSLHNPAEDMRRKAGKQITATEARLVKKAAPKKGKKQATERELINSMESKTGKQTTVKELQLIRERIKNKLR